jgi:hypothetical protein
MLSTDDKKSILLLALKELHGNVTRSVEAAQISRATYYNWLDQDEGFRAAVRAIQLEVDDQVLDQAEEVIRFWLTRKIDKDVAKWVLGKKGAGRGYGTKVVVEHQGEAFKDLTYPEEPETLTEWSKKGE